MDEHRIGKYSKIERVGSKFIAASARVVNPKCDAIQSFLQYAEGIS
jgi:hypothetical protein